MGRFVTSFAKLTVIFVLIFAKTDDIIVCVSTTGVRDETVCTGKT